MKLTIDESKLSDEDKSNPTVQLLLEIIRQQAEIIHQLKDEILSAGLQASSYITESFFDQSFDIPMLIGYQNYHLCSSDARFRRECPPSDYFNVIFFQFSLGYPPWLIDLVQRGLIIK